jgi:hypothetical protein
MLGHAPLYEYSMTNKHINFEYNKQLKPFKYFN